MSPWKRARAACTRRRATAVKTTKQGLQYGLDVYSPVDDRGRFTPDVEYFAGHAVFEANRASSKSSGRMGALIREQDITHEYPHCWRCKKPVIFRSTEQWFISMEKN